MPRSLSEIGKHASNRRANDGYRSLFFSSYFFATSVESRLKPRCKNYIMVLVFSSSECLSLRIGAVNLFRSLATKQISVTWYLIQWQGGIIFTIIGLLSESERTGIWCLNANFNWVQNVLSSQSHVQPSHKLWRSPPHIHPYWKIQFHLMLKFTEFLKLWLVNNLTSPSQ